MSFTKFQNIIIDNNAVQISGQKYDENDSSNKIATCFFVNQNIQKSLTSGLALKANITDVSSSLALKANITDVTSSLALKANITDVNSSLALKANITDVNSSLALKANITDVNNSLALKLDKTYFDASYSYLISTIDSSFTDIYNDISGILLDISNLNANTSSGTSGITLDEAVLQIEIEGMRDLPVFAQNWMLNSNGTTIYNGNGNYSNCIACSGNGQYIFIGLAGTSPSVFPKLSSDYGNTWTTVTAPDYNDFMNASACAISSTGQYMVAFNRTTGQTFSSIYYSNTYGKTWIRPTNSNSNSNTTIDSVAISSTGKYMLSAAYNKIVLSSDYGNTWNTNVNYNSSANSFNTAYRYVTMSHDGSIMYVTSNSNVYKSSDYGVTWAISNSSGTRNGHVSCSANGQYVLICPNQGFGDVSSNLYISKDYGVTFSNVGDICSYSQSTISACGRYMVATDGGFRSGPSNYRYGSIYASDDYGQSWRQVINSNVNGFFTTVAMSHSGNMVYGQSSNQYFGSKLYVSNSNYTTCVQTVKPYGDVPVGTIYFDASGNLNIFNNNKWYFSQFSSLS